MTNIEFNLAEHPVLVDVQGMRQVYHKGDNPDLVVLDDVSVQIREGEIVGLLGRSGSGKSTLLRIISGLLVASSGKVQWCGKPVPGLAKACPWSSELRALPLADGSGKRGIGLEAQGVAAAERRQRALQAIDLIGLDGFENAYPKELSAGCASASALRVRWSCIRA